MSLTTDIEKIFSDVENSIPSNGLDTENTLFPGVDDNWPMLADEHEAELKPINDELEDSLDQQLKEDNLDEDIASVQMGEGVGGQISEGGMEAIAYYKSPRFINSRPFRGKWGIFIFRERFKSLVLTMAHDTGDSYGSCWMTLNKFVDSHEMYHFKVDVCSLGIESFTMSSLWRPYLQATKLLPVTDWFEEGVANFHAISSVRPRQSFLSMNPAIYVSNNQLDFIKDIVSYSPGAYSMGLLDSRKIGAVREQMVMQLLNSIVSGNANKSHCLRVSSLKTLLANRLSSPFVDKSVPRYWVHSAVAYMQTKPLAVKLDEIKNGFVKKYLDGKPLTRTDHEKYKIDNGDVVKIPNPHLKDTKSYEFDNIIKHAGMSQFEFEAAREKTKRWSKNVPRSPFKKSRLI